MNIVRLVPAFLMGLGLLSCRPNPSTCISDGPATKSDGLTIFPDEAVSKFERCYPAICGESKYESAVHFLARYGDYMDGEYSFRFRSVIHFDKEEIWKFFDAFPEDRLDALSRLGGQSSDELRELVRRMTE